MILAPWARSLVLALDAYTKKKESEMDTTTGLKIRNLTPHAVTIFLEGRSPMILAPETPVPRVEMTYEPLGEVEVRSGCKIPYGRNKTGEVTDLPVMKMDTILIVSRMVREASGRRDLYFPDDIVRDDEGRVIGCRRLAK